MLMVDVGCVCVGFILCISVVQGQQKTVCALKGSSVELNCSDKKPTTSMKWYTVNRTGPVTEITAERNDKYKISEENNFNLTINELREGDDKFYCCSQKTDEPQTCRTNGTKLQVTDLQVRVFPTAKYQTVTLMCRTSCPLKSYSWFRNGKFLYIDPSPWYQELVSSDQTVKYSCGIKGYRDLRSPEVSVDSVTSTCFKVTYAKGTMCSHQKKSEDDSCSITYPREVKVQKTPSASGHVNLTCNSSCPLTDPQTVFIWYKNGKQENKPQAKHPSSSPDIFSCAVKDHENLISAEVCVEDKNCSTVNYVNRRICALQSSSINISSQYSHPDNKFKFWYKIKRGEKQEAEKLTEAERRVEFSDNKNHHNLIIKQLKKNDSAEYIFRVQTNDEEEIRFDYPGVTLVVTDLVVKFNPSLVVTEGDRVTLTCRTICPLTHNTNYIWSLNGRPLTLPENQNKHLVLHPVSSQHAGNYSCSVKTNQNKKSTEKTLTVQRISRSAPVAAGVAAVLLVIILLTVFCWIRSKRTSRQSPGAEQSENMEELNPVPEDEQDQDPVDLHYSTVYFSENHNDPPYSNIQHHQLQEQQHTPYAVVHLRSN
ncbi:uncharacterized protein LOC113161920 isoform X1 [Anabas testudineus]|uniref:uncharacterized protein LOC113161920 isoform X1 n=1 Tax=Anabas testudineus TaxID=64144 RepID=UPI000E45FE1E|nr:uncharacterized protein LOC113161920 isoform X1 [Anabas testudineus]XP_026215541.1 uncharacterized protein LOC113161920 isoform X1 [Anabas testudineus]